MSIRVGVFGAGGRMGRAVAHAINDAAGMELVAAVDPSFEGINVGEVTGVAGCEFSVVSSPESLLSHGRPSVDVMVDFTHVEAARSNIEFCAENGIHAVVGTSGFTEADHGAIAESFTNSNCLIAPNFAIGAVLMIRFAELAAPYFDTAEIIELHHDNKIDAPSGTAVSTAERIAAANGEWAADPTQSEIIAGARGAKGPCGIPIHSVRMRGMIAHQEVIMGTMGQTLTLRHDSYDRSSFMPGVLLGVRRVGEVPGLTVGLDRILNL
ncbi:MAG: 4-hydroxy-tetrahydrodipicolinate reductase [Acidimicrobiia bacterium]|nr:4-hydroxy-tetrahydrodipicolinate reductase [Acidimicrobiia bacterium]